MTAWEENRLRAVLLAISIANEGFAQASVLLCLSYTHTHTHTHTQPEYQDGSVKPQWPQVCSS